MSLDPHDNPRFWDVVDLILDADDAAGGGQLKALLAELRQLEDDYTEEAAALSAMAMR